MDKEARERQRQLDAGDNRTQGQVDGRIDDAELRRRQWSDECGMDWEGESMGGGEVQEPTAVGYGGAGLRSGLPVGRGDG